MIHTGKSWLYLAGPVDLFDGELADYTMRERMAKNLMKQTHLLQLSSQIFDSSLKNK